MKELLSRYEAETAVTIHDIIRFHYEFACIHPFQDGNGRVGRLIVLKECLRFGLFPLSSRTPRKGIITGDSLNGNENRDI